MKKKLIKFQFTEKEAAYLYEEIDRIRGYVGILGLSEECEPWIICDKFCDQYKNQINDK
jgi:hypothetical protein|tara:strand:+ start:591 stop:767 length:177 start_codon:yes stop_codon:yes gene_type:complete